MFNSLKFRIKKRLSLLPYPYRGLIYSDKAKSFFESYRYGEMTLYRKTTDRWVEEEIDKDFEKNYTECTWMKCPKNLKKLKY